MKKTTLTHWLLFGFLTFFWGTSFLQIALSLRSLSPEQIVPWRLILAALVLIIYLFAKGKKLPLALKDWFFFCLFAGLGNLLPYWLITTGQQSVTSGLAGLLMAVMPLVTIMLAHWLIPNEKLTSNRLIGFVLGISGVLFVLWPSLTNGSNSFLGAIIILMAACSYAVNTILIRLYSHHDPLVVSTGVMIAAAILGMLIWPQMWQVNWQEVSAISLIALIWLGIVPTGLASVVYFILVKQVGATFVSNNNYIIPVIAYLSGALVLGEQVSIYDFIALTVILAGIMISRR